MNRPMRPDREPPDPEDVARIETTLGLDLGEEIDEGEDEDSDDDLKGLDKTLADSFPASDPPQVP